LKEYYDIFKKILEDQHDDPKWNSARFGKIKIISNTKVGTVGQLFVEKICEKLKLKFENPKNKEGKNTSQSPWDLKIEDITFEIKAATEDVNGSFQFNHLRYHRDYEAVLCIGIAPNDVYFNIFSKKQISSGEAGKLVTMEKAGEASYKLTKKKEKLFTFDFFENEIKNFIVKFKQI
jgi:hypothetical protein